MKDKHVTVLGMARSGCAAARLIKHYGGKPFVSELRPFEDVVTQARDLEAQGIHYETGGHSERIFDRLDYAVLSPGIPNVAPVVRQIEERGLPLFSELEVASWLCPALIAAITGTNGKSTSTAWLAHLLKEASRSAVATGNIGSPFSHDVMKLGEDDFAVVEVSSFQLERIDTFRPHVAVILNIAPDHLDRYGSLKEYAAMKYRIADNQTPDDFLVLNADDENLRRAEFWGKPVKIEFSLEREVGTGVFVRDDILSYSFGGRSGTICPTSELGIPGPHNIANGAAIAAAALALGLNEEEIAAGLRSFRGIEHRIEHVDEINGVVYINDSKATNVDSVAYALQSTKRPIILIMGGRDKGGDFSALKNLLAGRVKEILVIGEAAAKITEQLKRVVSITNVETLEAAVKRACSEAKDGDAVLLSPGCASFDQFRDYEHRGESFKEAVANLKRGTA